VGCSSWGLLLLGCSSSGGTSTTTSSTVAAASTSTPSGTALSSGVKLLGSYSLSGAIAKHASFVDDVLTAKSCAAVASHGTGSAFAGGPAEFAVPTPPPPSGNATNVYFTAGVSPYKGPGTFSKEDILKSGGGDLTVGTAMYNPVAARATASMTVRPDGSGSFTFANAPPVTSGPSLSGTVTWTCSG